MDAPKDWNQQVIEEFRSNEGKVGGRYEKMKLLLLHTTGAKTGKQRLTPVATIRDGDKYVIIASKRGAPTHPDWYYNIVANPEVRVEVGSEKFQVLAEEVPEPKRTELYGKVVARYPIFAEYERKTERVIPVITLTRLS